MGTTSRVDGQRRIAVVIEGRQLLDRPSTDAVGRGIEETEPLTEFRLDAEPHGDVRMSGRIEREGSLGITRLGGYRLD